MSRGVGDLGGAVCVVTGGAAGIGHAVARSLRDRGATVVIADIEERALDTASRALGVEGIQTDVSRPADVERLASETVRRHGRIDVVVNNAGVARVAPFEELTHDDFRWLIDVNFWGVLHGVQTFLPIIERTSRAGFVVNTASMAGLRAAPRLTAYAATKFAVVGLTEALDEELTARGSHVGVGVLVPGQVRSSIAASERNRPGGPAAPIAQQTETPALIEADVVGETVADAIERGDLYIVTHADRIESVRERHRKIEAAFVEAGSRER
ncbi:SDR family NAD(P)-dependent oxidoreductase [Rhodococcus oxybenzonivorans]|uniref:SDR family NAD(P)-dependent oxidoreductase n=1 Tax=Rhodococcus oxybenzonivorans TaxID=1990687 RepID=UPI0029531C0D|nr:SDR family NAD(P)-dependent oxidoreductase [Rhodococcus oxybenzonivorans]MDV7352753.1 SDR family NAD(P)-dependent oxidoreductase [Rhodococcus oxybenzonivorans]